MKDGDPDDPQPGSELDALVQGYRRLATATPPKAVDSAVLANARAAADRRPTPRWWIPAAAAATVLIGLSLVLRIGQDASAPPRALEEGQAAPPPPAPASADARAAEASSALAVQDATLEGTRAKSAAATLRAPAAAGEAGALPDPEQWLERIEALKAEGRTEEAATQRQQLEVAYPGWLAQREAARD